MSDNSYYQRMTDAVVNGEIAEAARVAQQALEAGFNALDVINKGVVGGTDKLGALFQDFEIFLPELIMGGDAAKAAMAILVPAIPIKDNYERPGKIVMGTVFGDIHDIGKNLCAAMLAATGFEVTDLGVNVAPKRFVATAEEIGAKIIGLSALMSTSLYYQQDVINYLKDAGLRDKYYVIVGGGPVTPDWIRKIGADGGGKQANNVVEVCKQLAFNPKRPPFDEPLVIW
ncbi:MAG: corrinoid protein [Chloroflexi bacterium]|nr:corrinoid protein [Chloroflexota bacterium]